MSYKKIFIRNKSYLNYQNNSLKVKVDSSETLISLDDIDTLIIETQQTTLTSALLSELSKSNINVIFSDKSFMPTSMLLGINKNSRTTKILRAQISLADKTKGKLWKHIVVNKIKNQSFVLRKHAKNYNHLDSLIKRVKSADKQNIEAVAAAHYFKELFGSDFTRKSENSINASLNYGYIVLRSSICRYLIAYGLNPALGIHHSSELNSFNLADDIIEVYRPIVDDYVCKNIQKETIFNKEIKNEIIALLEKRVEHKGVELEINESIKRYVANYQSVCLEKETALEPIKLIK